MRRTVNISLRPWPRRPMTTPEKTWIRSLSPSTTLVWTRTLSPTEKFGTSLRNCSDSILSSNAWFINSKFNNHLSKQVRSAFLRPEPRLLGTPAGDLGVVARNQNIGNFHPAELSRPRVLRILEQPEVERFFMRTGVIAQHARQQPRYRVHNHHCRQRAVRQHVIANGQLIVRQPFAHAFIKTFVMAGDEQQMLESGQFAGDCLVKGSSRRRKQNHASVFPREAFDCFKERFRLEQHARPAAKGPVVHGAMPVMRVIAQIVQAEFQPPGLTSALDDALIERPREHRGKQRKHVYFHLPAAVE